MSWDRGEENAFFQSWSRGEGQIAPGTELGNFLRMIAKKELYTKYLEIGTWSGMGSTRCFHLGFIERSAPFVFKSLECNKDKCQMVAERYKNHPSVHIMNSSIIPVSSIPPIDTLKEMFEGLVEQWHKIDMENLATCPVLEDRDFEVVFFDGGEYTTYFEFKELVKSPSLQVIICNDTNMNKCKKVKEELLESPDWKILVDRPTDRNGWCAFIKV